MEANQEYAYFKRCLDDYTVDPKRRLEIDEDPKMASIKEAIEYITFGIGDEQLKTSNPYLRSYIKLYQQITDRVRQGNSEKAYTNLSLAHYEQIVRNRCRMENQQLRLHPNISYFPICMELTEGCSVQCDFCGLSAKRYAGSFELTPENEALFREILEITKRVVGPVTAASPFYLATEPLDNRDYEKYLEICMEIFGGIPQMTTAIAEVYPDRIRRIMEIAGPERIRLNAALRFSIRNLKQYQRLREIYSMQEMAYIEVLANNPESVNRISDTGRARRNQKIADKKRLSYSICCVSGVRVNLVRKSLEYIEPCIPSAKYPEGIRCLSKEHFDTGEEFEEKLRMLYETYALSELPVDRTIIANPNIKIRRDGHYIYWCGDKIHYKIEESDLYIWSTSCMIKGMSVLELFRQKKLKEEEREKIKKICSDLWIRGYLILKQ